jgi:hypothetical protein
MNENEMERYEAELRGTRPAPVPEDFMARLRAAQPNANVILLKQPKGPVVWRWLAPALALAAAVAGLLVVQANQSGNAAKQLLANVPNQGQGSTGLRKAGLMADYVQMDEELVSSFDVVATLPNGEPVRFRCRQWQDKLLVTDKTNGVEITQNTPRVEVVPVRFETY